MKKVIMVKDLFESAGYEGIKVKGFITNTLKKVNLAKEVKYVSEEQANEILEVLYSAKAKAGLEKPTITNMLVEEDQAKDIVEVEVAKPKKKAKRLGTMQELRHFLESKGLLDEFLETVNGKE